MKRALFTAALAATAATATATATQAAPPVRPKLIVAIAVDQYSSEVFNRYRETYLSGLKTLASGIAYPVGYQSHGATETCPGHSTILSGRHPAGTGIIANSWFDVKTGSNIYCVATPGQAEPNARGPQNMRVTTLGDWIKAAEPGARSFAVSAKDRAAITMAGKTADGVYWWVDGTGFVTSRFASSATPKIVAAAQGFNAALSTRWKANPPQLWPQPSATCTALSKPVHFGKLDISGEIPPEMAKGVTEDPDFQKLDSFSDALRASPTMDALTVDLAEQIIARENLGRGPATDVLAVSLSATDYVGHRFGNGGPEMCVQQAALDATIGRLLAAVERTGVPAIVVLTADHGGTDAAERQHDHDDKAKRLNGNAIVGQLNKAMRAQLAIEFDPIVGDADQLSINVGADRALADRVRDAAIAWLKQQPDVSAVVSRAEIEAATVPADLPADRLTMLQRFHLSYDPERSGDILVIYAERASFGIPQSVGDTVAGHGTPWDYDRQVPILFWWPGATPETRDAPARTIDIAPTLAAVAGIVPPVPVDGRCLDLGGNCLK